MKQAKNNTMKAVAIDRFGGPETLTMRTLPVPEVGPDEVLVRLNSADVAGHRALNEHFLGKLAVRLV